MWLPICEKSAELVQGIGRGEPGEDSERGVVLPDRFVLILEGKESEDGALSLS